MKQVSYPGPSHITCLCSPLFYGIIILGRTTSHLQTSPITVLFNSLPSWIRICEVGICSTFVSHFLLQNVHHGNCTKSVFTVPSDRGKKQNTAACVITDEELHLWNTACVAFFFEHQTLQIWYAECQMQCSPKKRDMPNLWICNSLVVSIHLFIWNHKTKFWCMYI